MLHTLYNYTGITMLHNLYNHASIAMLQNLYNHIGIAMLHKLYSSHEWNQIWIFKEPLGNMNKQERLEKVLQMSKWANIAIAIQIQHTSVRCTTCHCGGLQLDWHTILHHIM